MGSATHWGTQRRYFRRVTLYDLVIVGMGSGGMVAAEFAATMGLKVAAVERNRVGGDCLWTGCVPSKALLASAKVAHHLRTASKWGLPVVDGFEIDTGQVWKRIRATQQEIASSDDSPDRFRDLGVEMVFGTARLSGPHTVQVDRRRLRTRFVLLCTGSRPALPPIPGLSEVGYFTSENIFEQDGVPRSMVLLGGGPISIEMSQALVRLGVRVTVLQRGPGILPRDEPELVSMLTERLRDEGVDLRVGVEVERVSMTGRRRVLHGTEQDRPSRWEGEGILVGVGRRPNVEDLGLDRLGIKVGKRGIEVDERMRTSVPSVYATGDVAGRYLFTHSAGYEAVRAVRDMFFPGKGRAGALVPWCTFTDPELAHAGLTEAEARAQHGDDVEVHRLDLAHSDRARADGDSAGRIVAVSGPGGRLVGAHILAPNAGEMIHELARVVNEGGKLSDLSRFVHVYPTLSTSIAQLAAEATFQSAQRLRWLTRLSARWPFER